MVVRKLPCAHAIVQGYNDNSGLGPILGHYLNSTSDAAQVLVLIMNQQGDHQMETYFDNPSGNNNGGMFCKDERMSGEMQDTFGKINDIYSNSFKAIGGEYVLQDHENICAIRLPRTLFFEVGAVKGERITPVSVLLHALLYHVSTLQDNPPQHHRFNDSRIPTHVTYAYKQGATIVRNDDFYEMPEGATKTIDLLFLMANAPVSTLSLPESGSESYIGLAKVMELATKELSEKFPAFFGEDQQTTKQYKGYTCS